MRGGGLGGVGWKIRWFWLRVRRFFVIMIILMNIMVIYK